MFKVSTSKIIFLDTVDSTNDEAKRRFVEAVDDVQSQLDEYLKSREVKSRNRKNTKKNKKNRGFGND